MTFCNTCGAPKPTNNHTCSCSSSPKTHPVRPTNHWLPLHQYATQNYYNWNSKEADRFLERWISRIPAYACSSCSSKFKTEVLPYIQPDTSTPRKFAHTSWMWHNSVSESISKPKISWEEFGKLYGAPWYAYKHTPIFVTALSCKEQHLERQQLTIKSWKEFGAIVIAVNTSEEIRQLSEVYPVDSFVVSDEVADYSYPTQRIYNLAKQAKELKTTVFVINSDCEVYGCPTSIEQFINTPTQMLCVRWNYEHEHIYANQFQWGIDMMSFNPETFACLPKDFPYAIGHAMWDYAVPYYTLKGGQQFSVYYDKLLYHKEHKQNWDQSSWVYGSKWISDRTELDINREDYSAWWRESWDIDSYYNSETGLWMSGNNFPKQSKVLTYDQWKHQPCKYHQRYYHSDKSENGK